MRTGDGVISKVKRSKRGYGNYVKINHGFGYETLYAHMSKYIVKKGQKVKRGEVIGYVGNTGISTAPHLHYEVRKDNKKINPVNKPPIALNIKLLSSFGNSLSLIPSSNKPIKTE